MSVVVYEPNDPRVEPIWRGLEARIRPTYFLSWAWIENWLACLPRAEAPSLAVVYEGAQPVSACFLGRRRPLRHHLLPTRTLYVNTTGVERRDELCVEHNTLLHTPEAHFALAELVTHLDHWDEIVLPAIDRAELDDLGARLPPAVQLRIDREVAAPFVDLASVRAAHGGYLSLLGASTRAQIRRARREIGTLTVEVAETKPQALDIYSELVALHQRTWHDRGMEGAFTDPWFDQFHRRLISERVAHGEIQLVRVRANDATVGCLYNFVAYDRVLFYQSGFAQFADPHVKPGYLCHTAAIAHSASSGYARYDLLAGDQRYKRNLATGEVPLAWARIQRNLLRFAIEEQLRAWKRSVNDWRRSHTTA